MRRLVMGGYPPLSGGSCALHEVAAGRELVVLTSCSGQRTHVLEVPPMGCAKICFTRGLQDDDFVPLFETLQSDLAGEPSFHGNASLAVGEGLHLHQPACCAVIFDDENHSLISPVFGELLKHRHKLLLLLEKLRFRLDLNLCLNMPAEHDRFFGLFYLRCQFGAIAQEQPRLV